MPARTKTLPITTTSKEAAHHFRLGREAAFHWNVTAAHEHLDAAIAADPDLVLAYLHRAGSSRPEERQPYFDSAENSIERVTPAERHMLEVFRAFLMENDYERAITILRDLSAEYPEDHYLPAYLGLRFYMNLQRFDEAITQFERALEIRPNWPPAYNFIGYVALEKGDYAAAQSAFERYLELAPQEPQVYRSLGDLFCSLGRHAEAAAYYEQVLKRNPDFWGGWRQPGWMRDVLGWTYAEAGRYDEAERLLRENIRLHPTTAYNYDSLGRLYLQLGDHDKAAVQFAAALELEPGLSASQENLGLAHNASPGAGAGIRPAQERSLLPITTASDEARRQFILGRRAAHHYQFAKAREHLDAAIAADPTFVLAHLHRGGSAEHLFELEDYLNRAAQSRDRASLGEQQMIAAFHAFLLEQDYERAIDIFSRLSEEFKDDPYLLAYLGLRYHRNLGRHDEAAEQFRRALERDPGFVQAYNWLGYIAMDQGKYDAAEETFRLYIRLAPDQARPHNSLGVLYLRQGRYEEAVVQFEKALVQDEHFVESRENIARAHIMRVNGRFMEAFGQQDTTAIVALYTRSAQLLASGGKRMDGAEAIASYWQGLLDMGVTAASLETLEVYAGADGTTATELGRYRLAASDEEADVGAYVMVWLVTPEAWQRHRSIWTSNRPLGTQAL